MEGLNFTTVTIAIFDSAIGAAIGSGQVTSKTIRSMIHQSEMPGQSRIAVFIGAALVEAVPILGVVVSLLLSFR